LNITSDDFENNAIELDRRPQKPLYASRDRISSPSRSHRNTKTGRN